MGLGAGMTGLGQAFGYSPTAISGGTFDPSAAAYYASPYQTGVTDIAVREAEKQRDLARTGRMTGALGRGTFGGALYGCYRSSWCFCCRCQCSHVLYNYRFWRDDGRSSDLVQHAVRIRRTYRTDWRCRIV